jgi:uncharacterized protein (UPF0262 family)
MAEAKLSELRIDEQTWSAGTSERRREWRLAIAEVVEEGVFAVDGARGALRARVALEPPGVVWTVESGDGTVARGELSVDELRPHMTEYMQICEEMGKIGVGANSPKLEALDIAKRLTHDEAGETVRALLRVMQPDHPTARRIFTLLVTLFYDTTKLAAPPHPVRS